MDGWPEWMRDLMHPLTNPILWEVSCEIPKTDAVDDANGDAAVGG